ncbi:asparagine synthetase B [Sutcliffiella horikoshii]|uniref:asparagine synthase-related protein n=1 Tax=Sutcliffiella horikoshii TaxID=79883 RepID=UPI001CBF8E23|nr:asparagine synthase-related protein [Sutcliffiella horikoshii]UAL46927.1 asparagine synthetase B [Sutcliffiella horikoshii]
MSAIAGIYDLNNGTIPIEHAQRMMGVLKKYYADDVGTIFEHNLFMGSHAQWITPESVGEKLPFYDQEKKLAITADAIIDNREELFEKLQIKNELRKKVPDSQIILTAYHKWGEDSVKHLVGDFAFVIWDERKQMLFAARDFTGTRSLYYTINKHQYAFCSVIEPLLTLNEVSKRLDEEWLAEYLAISGMIDTIGASSTPIKNIVQLPPGHFITVSNRAVKVERYCMLSFDKKIKLKNDNEYVEAFQDVFNKAVQSRLRTHRSVGAQLSGGLDSGSVVSFAVRNMQEEKKALHTFSYVPTTDFVDFTPHYLRANESEYVNLTIKHVGGIKPNFLSFDEKNSYSEIDTMLEIMEMPYKFFENSFWLKGMFESAQEHDIGILLNGDRGNYTISWGNALVYYAELLKKLKWFKLVNELNSYSKVSGGKRLRNIPILARISFPLLEQIFNQGSKAQSTSLQKIINPKFAKQTNIYEKLKSVGIGETGWFDTTSIQEERKRLFERIFPWNAGNTLTSKLSLKHVMWKRDPTNDLRVYQFCLSIPEEQYVKHGIDRYLIRRSTQNYLPNEVRLNNRIKGVQGVDWVHRMKPIWGEFISEVVEMLNNKAVMEFFNIDTLKAALAVANNGPNEQYAINPDYKVLMRSLIVYRYLKNFY